MNLNEAKNETESSPESEMETSAETPPAKPKPKIQFRWKGRIVKESLYRHRMAVIEAAKKRKKPKDPNEFTIPVEGRRIVDIALLAKHLQCTSCNEILSLRDIKNETRRGLASIFHIKCRGCEIINFVPTSSRTVQKDNVKSKLYNVNYEFVNGALQSGVTLNRLNKLLTCLNIPQVQRQLFDRHKPEADGAIDVPTSEEPPEFDNGTEGIIFVNTETTAAQGAQNSEKLLDVLPDSM